MDRIKIGIFLGSFRKQSFSRQVASIIADFMSAEFEMKFIEFGDMDLYNQDLETENVPEEWEIFREQVKELDGFLFVTPEYNRSFPPVLKNALDIGSRPSGNNVWGGKPGAVVSLSSGKMGGFGANHHLRQCMVYLNIYLMQQPEAYLGNISAMIGDDGMPKDERSRNFLKRVADAFGEWVKRFVRVQ